MWFQLTLFALIASMIVIFAGELTEFSKKFKLPFMQKKYVQHLLFAATFSVLVLGFADAIAAGLSFLERVYRHFYLFLEQYLGTGIFGRFTSHTIVLLSLSCIPSIIIGSMYWFVRQRFFEPFYHVCWLSWVVLVVMIVH